MNKKKVRITLLGKGRIPGPFGSPSKAPVGPLFVRRKRRGRVTA